jgi:nicotinamide mononucleotide transporter
MEFLDYQVLGMSVLEIIAVTFTFFSILLSTKEKIWTFPLALIGTSLFLILFFKHNDYSSAALQLIFIAFNIFGWYHWLYPSKKDQAKADKTLAVSRMSLPFMMLMIAITAVLYFVLVFVMSHVHIWIPILEPTRFVWISTFILTASIVGQYLMAVKKLENWAWWIAVDIIAAPYYFFLLELRPTGILYLVFIGTGFLGLHSWKKSYKANSTQK